LYPPQKAQKEQTASAKPRRHFVTSALFVAEPVWASIRPFLFAGLLLALLLPASAFAQKKDKERPKLLPMSRRDFAGKVFLVPRDARVLELKTLGQIADHYLVLPPSRMLDPKPQAEPLLEWFKSQAFTGTSGAVVSLESLAGDATAEEIHLRLQTIKQIRKQHPKLQIYGFASIDSSNPISKLICQTAIELVAENSLDFLLIGQDEDLSLKPAQIARARLIGEIAQQEAADRIAFDDDPDSAAATLLARLFVRRFGWSPKILPVYSSNEGRQSRQSRDAVPLDQSIAAKINLNGGLALPLDPESIPRLDVLLYVHTPQTSEEQRAAFASNILQTVDKGARVAVVDFSESMENKEALLAELRRHKLLGKIIAYASCSPTGNPAKENTREAASRALAQTTVFFVAMKSLRDDIDRVHRIDRAQANLLFSRLLKDWAYDLIVRPQVDQFVRDRLKSDPDKFDEETADRAVQFTFDALKPKADELFDEQFRRNTHVYLMNNGSRVQFRVSLLQRLQIRFPLQKTSKAEIRQMIHTFYEGTLESIN